MVIDPLTLAQRIDLSRLTKADMIELRLIAESRVREQIAELLRHVAISAGGRVEDVRYCRYCHVNRIRVGGGRAAGSKQTTALYCSTGCRKAAYRQRRAQRDSVA